MCFVSPATADEGDDDDVDTHRRRQRNMESAKKCLMASEGCPEPASGAAGSLWVVFVGGGGQNTMEAGRQKWILEYGLVLVSSDTCIRNC